MIPKNGGMKMNEVELLALEKKYQQDRGKLADAIDELNRYLRRLSYEMALKQSSPTLLTLLQAEFELSDEDELKFYKEFKEIPEGQVFFEFLTWWDALKFALGHTDPPASKEMQNKLEEYISNCNVACAGMGLTD